jgi:hypothetical protein
LETAASKKALFKTELTDWEFWRFNTLLLVPQGVGRENSLWDLISKENTHVISFLCGHIVRPSTVYLSNDRLNE